MKVLITRTDSLTDLVLSLPVFPYLRSARPDLDIQVLVSESWVPLVENNPHLSGVWTWAPSDSQEVSQLLKERLAAENYAAVVMLNEEPDLGNLLKSAGIKARYGRRTSFRSRFVLNKGHREKAATGQLHEKDRNLALVQRFLGSRFLKAASERPADSANQLKLTRGQQALGQEFRDENKLGEDNAVFIHPGTGDSMLDWMPERFAGVANALMGLNGFRVFVLGSAQDGNPVEKMTQTLDKQATVLLDQFNLRDFLGILSAGDYFIGPLTGSLHLAAALGLGTVGLFPPVKEFSSQRWAPWGCRTQSVTPKVDCPVCEGCPGSDCPQYNCMETIFERDVLEAVMKLHRIKTEELF
ncbi:MAG: glycosyltransferase family 9 protein [bacterium]|nr:glycosyltransferase family 9 protein [bacterium]